MEQNTTNRIWHAVHLYYSGEADKTLREFLYPYLTRLRNLMNYSPPFFFVRYFDGSYHIRLRMYLSEQENDWANRLLDDSIKKYNGRGINKIHTKDIPYNPEIDRYGNNNTINLAEQQFVISSRVVLDWLEKQESISLSSRYIQALKLHIAFFKGMAQTKSSALTICTVFIEGWLPYLYEKNAKAEPQREKFLSHFQSEYAKYKTVLQQTLPEYWKELDQTKNSCLAAFAQTNRHIILQYDASKIGGKKLHEIYASFIHMTNNRLGISNRDEAFIMYLVKQCLTILKDK